MDQSEYQFKKLKTIMIVMAFFVFVLIPLGILKIVELFINLFKYVTA